MLSLGLDNAYSVERMRVLVLHPEYEGSSYEWRLNDSLVAITHDYVFCQAMPDTYQLSFRIIDEHNPVCHEMTIRVWEEQVAYSPYISKVYEYCPAPGQFVNVLPQYDPGDNYEIMLRKAEEQLVGDNTSIITLGGWGGYVTFGFDHAVMNYSGVRDFQIRGNAVQNGNTSVSSEPGIVMVSADRNGNGIPDDEWYELQGSEHGNSETLHNYSLTYTNGDSVTWTDNRGQTGCIPNNTFHTQPYFPQWLSETELSFNGTCLPPNVHYNGSVYVYTALDYGYADNKANTDTTGTSFDISWAVDKNGEPANLDFINFVRVYTGTNAVFGWVGEMSTEVMGALDLHIE